METGEVISDSGRQTTGGWRSGRSASFFDVDHTLILGDTQEMEGRYLLAREGLRPDRILTCARVLAGTALLRLGLITQARQNREYLNIYKGRTRQELDSLGRTVFDREVRSAIPGAALDLLSSRRMRGDLIVLVSATTAHLIRPLEELVVPDYTFCTNLAFDRRGRATGQAEGGICIHEKKAVIIRDFARKHHLDLGTCRAYSDHHSDLPMLGCVGHPHAVNPTPRLNGLARSRGWPVLWFSR